MAKQKLTTDIEPDTEDETFEFFAEHYADEIEKFMNNPEEPETTKETENN